MYFYYDVACENGLFGDLIRKIQKRINFQKKGKCQTKGPATHQGSNYYLFCFFLFTNGVIIWYDTDASCLSVKKLHISNVQCYVRYSPLPNRSAALNSSAGKKMPSLPVWISKKEGIYLFILVFIFRSNIYLRIWVRTVLVFST